MRTLLIWLLLCGAALGQGCGPNNPNCIIPPQASLTIDAPLALQTALYFNKGGVQASALYMPGGVNNVMHMWFPAQGDVLSVYANGQVLVNQTGSASLPTLTLGNLSSGLWGSSATLGIGFSVQGVNVGDFGFTTVGAWTFKLPTAAGGGGQTVCIDSGGTLYRKNGACP